jgi:hypothetical protein
MIPLSLPRPGRLARLAAWRPAPASPRPLAWLRVGLSAVLLLQALALAGSLEDLYGPDGIVPWSVVDAYLARPGEPSVRWLEAALAPWGASGEACLWAVFVAYLAGLSGLLVGWRTRWSALVAWLTHLALNSSGEGSTYGVDLFAHIALFYCVVMPVGHALSADGRAGRASAAPSVAARVSLWVLQFHLCVVYLSSGLAKASGPQWWDGEAIWRAVMPPSAGPLPMAWLAAAPWLAVLAGWGTLLLEVGYALFVWPRRTRRPWALATVGLHAGTAVTMNLWSFAAVMVVLNVAAFLVPAEPAPLANIRPGGEGAIAGDSPLDSVPGAH